MAKRGKATAVPTMRFPGFRSETWEAKALGSVSDIKTGPFGSTLHQSDYVDVGTPIVTVEHLSDYGLVHANLPLVSDKDRSRLVSYALKAGDIVFSRVGSVDRNSLVGKKEDGWLFSGRLLRIRTDVEKVNPPFLSFYFQLEGTKQTIRSVAVGQTMPSLNTEILNAFPVVLTTLPEQLKIADCLTSLDEVIAAQGRKVEALKAHKRGLMQQLFPREGKTRPRLRFPEFRSAPEWSTVPLGELLEGKPEYGVNAPAVPFSPSLPSYLRITDIDTEGRFVSAGKVSVDIDATAENYLSDGDIALARTGASVGKSYCYREEDGRLVFAGFLIRIRPNRRKAVPTFVSSFLTTQQYWNWVHVISARSGQPGINGTEYAALPIPIPPSSGKGEELAEQQRIADCLSSLDTQITAESNQLAALKTHKQGLMQQLFPVPEAAGA